MKNSGARRSTWAFAVVFAIAWVGLLLAPSAGSRSLGDWPLYMIYLQMLNDGFQGWFEGPVILSVIVHWVSSFAVGWLASRLCERRLRSRAQ